MAETEKIARQYEHVEFTKNDTKAFLLWNKLGKIWYMVIDNSFWSIDNFADGVKTLHKYGFKAPYAASYGKQAKVDLRQHSRKPTREHTNVRGQSNEHSRIRPNKGHDGFDHRHSPPSNTQDRTKP